MKVFTTIFSLLISLATFSQNLFSETDAFLKAYVEHGLVNYAGIKKSPSELNALIKELAEANTFEGDEEKAFLINAYNVFVIKGIVDHYPTEGPLAIEGFFDKKQFKFRGGYITLNELEKETLYKQFPDARLHFALVCAALGCPKLGSFAYTGTKIDSQLERQTSKVINDPAFIRSEGSDVQVSQIFDWYASDFGGKDQVVPFIQKYLVKKVRLSQAYSFYEYDWSLNELK
jgi:hypothetical protein